MSHSRKIYLSGSRSDIRVPMREITLSGGEPALRLYDTGGLYTDADAHTDIKRGLPPLRSPWVLGRGDVEELPGPTSQYRRRRDDDPTLGGVRFASVRRPLRARPGRVVTQMHYARRTAQSSALMIVDSDPAPLASRTFAAKSFAFGATPMTPVPFCGAAMIPATWAPWPLSSLGGWLPSSKFVPSR
jgi:hypothetical protein